MYNNVKSGGADTERIANILLGHHLFMLKNKGETTDATQQHYVTNLEYVLSNNRHFIAKSMQVYQPNGDATTEGQSLQILGYAYAYMATGYQPYLEQAKSYFDAYIEHFYYGQAIPDTPQRLICNWLVNGKEPVPSNFPVSFTDPTNSGYKSVPIQITDGVAQIPHGAPFYGEHTDKVTFVHRGHNTWESIVANVVNIMETVDWDEIYANYRVTTMPEEPTFQRSWIDWDGYLGTTDGYTPDWSQDGTQEPINVKTVIVRTGELVDVDSSDVLSEGHTTEEIGTITFEDTTLNGVYLLNYAVTLPIEEGGYLLERNKPWHNRPLNVPVATDNTEGTPQYNQMGNASDAEQWFGDAAYTLWKLTGEDKYKKVWDCVQFTVSEYVLIDAEDKFFRQSTQATIPFTDGISYDFYYPSDTVVDYTRDADGYIVADIAQAADLSLEQQTIWYRVTRETLVRSTYGGVDTAGNQLTARIRMVIGTDKTEAENGIPLIADLPPSTTTDVVATDIPIGQLMRETKDDGSPYLLADARGLVPYGDSVATMSYETGINDQFTGYVASVTLPNSDAGTVVDFSYLDDPDQPLTSILYKSDCEVDIRIEDADGYRWYWVLPNTAGVWTTTQLDPAAMTFSGYQPNHPDDEEPTTGANFTTVSDFTVLLENSDDVDKNFWYYCVNELPATYDIDDGYTFYYRLTITGKDKYTARIGDCYCIDQRDDPLAYTPGTVPFSNIYSEGSYEIGSWRGMPYPGYQHPMIFALDSSKVRYFNNMVDFLYDSQKAFHDAFGVYGPGMSAYIWNRWDNYAYGDPDTWTMYNWGTDEAWSGYQPRAFHSAARSQYELLLKDGYGDMKLNVYIGHWVSYLIDFMKNNNGVSPTTFKSDGTVIGDPDDFTGHMSGLWLAGASFAKLAGVVNPELDWLIEALAKELMSHYQITEVPEHVLNGTWSPAQRLNTGSGPENNGMFFGFYSGEIMRGLSVYMLSKRVPVRGDIYTHINPAP